MGFRYSQKLNLIDELRFLDEFTNVLPCSLSVFQPGYGIAYDYDDRDVRRTIGDQ